MRERRWTSTAAVRERRWTSTVPWVTAPVNAAWRWGGQAGVVATQRNPIDLALDVFVFAPLGATIEFWERMPEHAKIGRERLGKQAPAARMIGEMAVTTGRRKVEERLEDLGILDGDDAPAGSPEHATPKTAASKAAASTTVAAEEPAEPATAGEPAALPIEDYDGLPAVQIIPLLTSLTQDERDAVRAHETAGRGRRTIIGKLDQLDARES